MNNETEWTNPTPLRSDGSQLTLFPLKAMPDTLREMASAIAITTSTDAAMAGTAILSAVSYCFSGMYRMAAKRDHTEPLVLDALMKNALKRVGLHKFASKRVDTVEGDILCIDRNGNITRSEFQPKIYRSKHGAWYDYDDSSYYNMHEEILLAYCGCYGVGSEDVELLLEYGYTCDEIEEMLMDMNLLHEALRDVKYMCGESLYESCCGGAW